ncbi:MAG: branched-chain amino acid ABC transporter permease [Oscillospiraceae bacterium]|nr:branched-chain amino acid ABC transporter permease [Oscillospiraceae bacterium]
MKHERTIPMPAKYLINTILTVIILAGGTALMNAGAFNRATTAVIQQIGIYIILAVSLNMVVGYLGQLPLGHSGFMAVGAYAGALFWKATQNVMPSFLTILLGLIVAGLVAAVFGVIIGIPALRLKGDYLAIITLGFSEIIRICIINLPSITGGTPGLLNIPKYSGFFVVFASVAVTCYVIHTIMHSRHGRAILSIRDNEIAADACGINLTYYKVFTFAVSAFFAGVAGALYAGYQGSLFPKSFDFMASINILVMVVLGGMGSMLGSAVAATVLTALPLVMQSLSEYRMVIYSLLLIIVMIFKPSGLMGQYDFSFTGIIENIMNGRLFRRKKKAGGTKNE